MMSRHWRYVACGLMTSLINKTKTLLLLQILTRKSSCGGRGGTYLGWGGGGGTYLGRGVWRGGTYLHGWERGYLPWSRDTYLSRGVPTLAGGYLPWIGGTYLGWEGTYLGQGVYLPWPGVIPTLDGGGGGTYLG